jgi:hypothetical protein
MHTWYKDMEKLVFAIDRLLCLSVKKVFFICVKQICSCTFAAQNPKIFYISLSLGRRKNGRWEKSHNSPSMSGKWPTDTV